MSLPAAERAAPLPGRSDAELIELVLSGHRDQYVFLVRRYQDQLYRHALGMVLDPDAAADLVQDSFVKAYGALRRCHDHTRFGGWLFRILRNHCLDYLKQRRRKDISLDDQPDLAAHTGSPESALDQKYLAANIRRAVALLPETMREAFLLKHVEDLSYEEMQEKLGVSASALRMRVLRAREILKTALAEYAADDVIQTPTESSIKWRATTPLHVLQRSSDV